MRNPSADLILFHHDPSFRGRVREAAGRELGVRTVGSWTGLADELRAAPLTSTVVVDAHAGPDGGLALELRVVLRDYPCAVVLAVVWQSRSTASELRTLGEWGVTDVIAADQDGAAEIRALLHATRRRPLADLIRYGLPEDVTTETRRLLGLAAEVAVTGGGTPQLARMLHVSIRTLVRRCEGADLPTPRQLLGWMRVLLAAELLEEPRRDVESIARACGYAADSGLRRALKDMVGSCPSELRKAGPFGTVSAAFLAALTRGRKPHLRALAPAACLQRGRGRTRETSPLAA